MTTEGFRRNLRIWWSQVFDPLRAHENIFARRQAPGNVLTHYPVSHLLGAFQYRSYCSHSKVNGWRPVLIRYYGSEMRGPARMAFVDYQGMAVSAMPLQVGMIERQVVVRVFKLHGIA